MKTIIAILLLASAASHPLLGSTPMDPSAVYVKVHCEGTDLAAASIPMGEYAGKLLEDTFALIHPPTAHDDSNLTGLIFHGHGMSLEDYHDHQDNTIERHHHTTPAVYTGYWNCRYGCPEDNDKTMKTAWEAAFASELASSGMGYFEHTKSCSIAIELVPITTGDSNAHVQIKCKGINIKHVSVAEATYAAHALQASYNKVHGHHEGDHKSMDHVTFDTKKSMELVADAPNRLGLWYAQWWAMLMASILYEKPFDKPYDDDLPGYCWGEDDDDVRWWLSGIGTQKWEAQFTKYLKASEIPVFQKVKSCSITVEPTEELKDVLREDGCPKRLATSKQA